MPTHAQPEPTSPKPKRRWLQFRLRTLLGVVTVAAVWLGLIVNSAERQRRAVAAIRELGGVVIYDNERGGVDWRTFADNKTIIVPPDYAAAYLNLAPSRVPVRDRGWFRKLLGDDYFESVVRVDLGEARFIDAALAHLQALPDLQELNLANTQVTDAGLEIVSAVTGIQALFLSDTNVTAGLTAMAGRRSVAHTLGRGMTEAAGGLDLKPAGFSCGRWEVRWAKGGDQGSAVSGSVSRRRLRRDHRPADSSASPLRLQAAGSVGAPR